MSVNVPGENSGTKGQTGTKGQGQRQGYSLPPYVKSAAGADFEFAIFGVQGASR